MAARLTDISGDFLAFWDRAQGRTPDEQKRLWQELYEEPHREIFDIYFGQFGNRASLDRALARYPGTVETIRQAREGLAERIDASLTRCAALFEEPSAEFDYVTMVGVFNSNGWAIPFRGRPASFLALEWFSEPIYLDILIAHEAAHAFHALAGQRNLEEKQMGQALFNEGLATLASELLCPGLRPPAYLWFAADWGDWVQTCTEKRSALAGQFLSLLEQSNTSLYNAWFMMGDPDPVVPVRAGYYLGCEVVRRLHQRHSIAEMARWSPGRVLDELAPMLTQLAVS